MFNAPLINVEASMVGAWIEAMKQIERGGKSATRLFSNFRRCYLRFLRRAARRAEGIKKREEKRKVSGVSAVRAWYLNIQRCVYNRSTCSRVKVTLLDNSPDTFPTDLSVECNGNGGNNDQQQLSTSNVDIDQIAYSEIDVSYLSNAEFPVAWEQLPFQSPTANTQTQKAKRSM